MARDLKAMNQAEEDFSLAAFDDLLWSVNAAEQNPWDAGTGRSPSAAAAPRAKDASQQAPGSSWQPFSHSTEAAEVDSLFSSILQGAPSANMLTISGTDITSSSAPDEGRSDRADLQQSESYESHSEHEHPRSSPEHSVQTLEHQPAKRRVGRPLKFGGELCAAHLPRPERAQVMRRIANRESARRVRKRKQDDMNDLSLKAEQAERNQAVMQSHVLAVDKRYNELFSVFKEVISQRYDAENAVEALQTENNLLKQELATLRAPRSRGQLPNVHSHSCSVLQQSAGP